VKKIYAFCVDFVSYRLLCRNTIKDFIPTKSAQVKNSALKELRKLPKAIADQVAREIDSLSVNPGLRAIKNLRGITTFFVCD